VAPRCERVVVLDRGRVQWSGPIAGLPGVPSATSPAEEAV
jgi:hypothetical protein